MSPLYILSLGFLLLHVPHWCPSSAAASDTLTAGQSLAVGGSKLVSGNGKFALGFFQPAASTISHVYLGRHRHLERSMKHKFLKVLDWLQKRHTIEQARVTEEIVL